MAISLFKVGCRLLHVTSTSPSHVIHSWLEEEQRFLFPLFFGISRVQRNAGLSLFFCRRPLIASVAIALISMGTMLRQCAEKTSTAFACVSLVRKILDRVSQWIFAQRTSPDNRSLTAQHSSFVCDLLV